MTSREPIPWTRLVWDTNRLRRRTQRDFHAATQERAGATTIVTDTAARELAKLIEPRDLEGSLEAAYHAYQDPRRVADRLLRARVQNPEAHIAANVWWAEEWLRPDSVYELRVLTPDERTHANVLLDHMIHRRVFPGLEPETVEQYPDAVIICETAAVGRRYLMTEDLVRVRGAQVLVRINQWNLEAQQEQLIDEPRIVLPADQALIEWLSTTPGAACEAVATAFWPRQENAQALEVEARVREMIPVLSEARLPQVALAAERELSLANDWPSRVERMRPTLPVRARAADRRHPAHPENQARDWGRPTEDFGRARTLRRWKVRIAKDRTTVEQLGPGPGHEYRTTRTFPAGAEHALAEWLIDQDIEINGLPRHGGRRASAGDGGFTTTLTEAVGVERATLGIEGPEQS